MVAKMTAFACADALEDGNGDVSPLDAKDILNENENGSDSTEESSEEDESDEGSTEANNPGDESDAAAGDPDQDTAVDPKAEEHSEEVALTQPCCERCKAILNENYDSVTPRKLSRDRLQLMLEDEGTYKCSVTGLVFEVSQKVQIQYSTLSWSKFGMFLKDSWKFAGPIFNIECDPSILKSVQFPHTLCLADQESKVTFSVLHVKNSRPLIEPTVDHSGSHVKWTVTSLSPVGPIVQTPQLAEHHGVVLVYKEVCQRSSCSFRVYLATNNHSDIKDISKEVRNSKKKYVKIEKPPTCQRLLEENKKYRLTSEPEGEIAPVDLQFTMAVVKIKGYFEAFFEQPPPFKLSLIEADSGQTVWTATLREGDCEDNIIEKPRRRTESRKRSSSTSEEELSNKRTKWEDMPDGVRNAKNTDVTDQQLMMVAKEMGKEWKQVAICYLSLSMQDIEEVQDEDLTMRKFKMLDLWRRRAKGDANVARLQSLLNQKDVPNGVRDVLEDMLANNSL
ncbi:uncharacterized protein LOC108922486 isoform X2 [Scleropages formosus]|uniref:uncharacterized protein LOC108922486 isoform X2 n=1 Tax=Scleropages formosus TaxID=113540 RepID=UPI0008788AEF|nr:uncharacterized protein LOC108922486 isoform X2 [Scleropages formosus]